MQSCFAQTFVSVTDHLVNDAAMFIIDINSDTNIHYYPEESRVMLYLI